MENNIEGMKEKGDKIEESICSKLIFLKKEIEESLIKNVSW